MTPEKIVGAGNKRRPNDFYPTPSEVTEALLNYLMLPRRTVIWEPACGSGAICDVLRNRGYRTIGTDIETGTDFLTADTPADVDFIITNPPFSLAEQFIRKAASTQLPFAFLLKCQFWHAAKRLPLFYQFTPAHVLPLTWRPDFTGQKSSLLDMQWCVWWPTGAIMRQIPGYMPLRKPKEGRKDK